LPVSPRRIVVPQLLDQALDAHDPVRLQDEEREQRALSPASEREQLPVSLRFDRPQSTNVIRRSSEAENEREGAVHGAKLVCVEAPGGRTEPLWVHDRCLLDEDPRLLPFQLDCRSEARRARAR
jgi:hypothetical protein